MASKKAANLTDQMQVNLIPVLRKCFLSISNVFDPIQEQVRLIIRDVNHIEQTCATTRDVEARYFNVEGLKGTEAGRTLLAQIQIIARCCCVLVLEQSGFYDHLKWRSVSELLQHYPAFQGQPREEQELLLRFRNYMVLALQLVPAKLNKRMLIYIAGRLESGEVYNTGGGQKPSVSRRVLIYETEGHQQMQPRPVPRIRRGSAEEEHDEVHRATSTALSRAQVVDVSQLETDNGKVGLAALVSPTGSVASSSSAKLPMETGEGDEILPVSISSFGRSLDRDSSIWQGPLSRVETVPHVDRTAALKPPPALAPGHRSNSSGSNGLPHSLSRANSISKETPFVPPSLSREASEMTERQILELLVETEETYNDYANEEEDAAFIDLVPALLVREASMSIFTAEAQKDLTYALQDP